MFRIDDIGLAAKFRGVFAVFVLLLAGFAAFATMKMSAVREAAHEIEAVWAARERQLADLRYSAARYRTAEARQATSAGEELRAADATVAALAAEVARGLDAFVATAQTDTSRRLGSEARAAWAAYQTHSGQGLQAARDGRTDAAISGYAAGRPLFDAVAARIGAIIEYNSARSGEASAMAAATYEQAKWLLTVAAAMGAALAIALALYFDFRVTRPLRAATASMARLADGDPDVEVAATARKDEVGRMVQALGALKTTVAKAFMQAQMIEEMPSAVMLCDVKDDFRITYANPSTMKLMKVIEHLLPIKADSLVGQTIDIFHKRPQHQRKMLADPANLPHNARIKIGDETLDLRVAAIRDRKGEYVGPMLSWSVITRQVKIADDFEVSVKGVADAVASASTEMQAAAQALSATAEEASRQATAVAAAAEQAAANVSTVAGATEELTASIQEIGQQVERSTRMSVEAVEEARRADQLVAGLSEAAQRIGAVVDLINGIAAQTNLLALNATIEAARAGEAGKGFAVVAGEVKQLATQTAKATEEIGQQIGGIQGATREAVEAIRTIGRTIETINEVATAISAAVEEQAAATRDIATNVQQAAVGTQEVTRNIAGVSQASAETGEAASQVLEASGTLSKDAEVLGAEVDGFLASVRAA
jgi:methyl-accepting chemotaxis protein